MLVRKIDTWWGKLTSIDLHCYADFGSRSSAGLVNVLSVQNPDDNNSTIIIITAAATISTAMCGTK